MTAVLAILRESWLTLRAEKLFKLTLALNALVIVAYASIGFNDTGFTLFYGLISEESEYMYAGSPFSRTLYLGIYSAFIVGLWLAWAATILALISTSSIFPTFLREGSVELTMSRPTRRSTIFLVKYVGGLIFVLLQVAVFTIGAFFAVGWRIGVWDPSIFLAIPLVTLFFSYLFCINVLVGVLTRSTLVALLATILFWFSTFGLRTADDLVTRFWLISELSAERTDERLATLTAEADAAVKAGDEAAAEDAQHWMAGPREEHDRATEVLDRLRPWRTGLHVARIALPETSRTIGLLRRVLERDADVTLDDLMTGRAFEDEHEPDSHLQSDEARAEKKMAERENAVPGWRIIGKSLLFECSALALALWLFGRRDY